MPKGGDESVKSFPTPKGYEGSEPRIEVTTTQTFYPEMKPAKAAKHTKPPKMVPMEVKIVAVAPEAKKQVAKVFSATDGKSVV